MDGLPNRISGFRSRPINGLIDYLSGEDERFGSVHVATMESRLPFAVRRSGVNTIAVHGGSWTRINLATVTGTTVDLTCDSGASASYDDVKTITITQSGYIYIALDDDDEPTALTAAFSATLPAYVGTLQRVLAIVTWDGTNSVIGKLLPVHPGGHVIDSYGSGVALDEISVDFNTGSEVEINDWSTEATTRTESMGTQDGRIINGGFLVRPAVYNDGTGEYDDGFAEEPEYVSPRVIVFNVDDWSGIDLSAATINLAWSGLTDTVGDPTAGAAEYYMPMVRETSPGAGTYALELTAPATIVSTLFAASGGITDNTHYLLDSSGVKRLVSIENGLITGIAGWTP